MDLGLHGRSALVFGGSSGLGLATVESLRDEGASVVAVARGADQLRQHCHRIGAIAVPGDITSTDDIHHAVSAAVESHGGLDIVVTNGGGPPAGPATAVDPGAITAAADLLLRPVATMISASLPHLRTSAQGRIISISSGSVHEPIANLALSNAVRPGVWGYLKTLAAELAAEGITVNSVGPGRVATDRIRQLFTGTALEAEIAAIPAGRLGDPRSECSAASVAGAARPAS
jgi:3-oxoacyl-[acyl-carrier protein] reductase